MKTNTITSVTANNTNTIAVQKEDTAMKNAATLYAIGYAKISIESFVAALKRYDIKLVVDIRSTPYSGAFPNYNLESLQKTLASNGIKYANAKQGFGARHAEEAYISYDKTEGAYFDHRKWIDDSPVFKRNFEIVESFLLKGINVAILCAENRAVSCHRFTMVGRAFNEAGYDVRYCSNPNTTPYLHHEIEKMMAAQYGQPATSAGVAEAYKRAIKTIGFRPSGR